MRIDYRLLAERLFEAGLTGKAVNDYSKEEIEILVSAVIETLIPEKNKITEAPSVVDGILHIPLGCDPRYFWWRPCGQSVSETLRELKVTDEIWKRYVDDKS